MKEARLKQPGAYILTHVQSGRFYVGSTNDLHLRSWQHRNSLKHGSHRNKALQALYDVDQELKITWIPIMTRDEAYDLEQELMDTHGSDPLLLNVARNARNPGEFTPEIREKIAAARAVSGYKHSSETLERQRQAQLGKKLTEETKAKMREASSLAKAVIIDCVEYESQIEASRKLGRPLTTVRRRIASPDFPNWRLKNEN